MFTIEQLQSAHSIVQEAMDPTPQRNWPLLSQTIGIEVWVKHENQAPTGGFKVRGGLTYLNELKRSRPEVQGMVSATRGNHGQSLAFAAARHGLPVTIVVPLGNSVEKNAAMKAFGATLIEQGVDFQAAVEHAKRIATQQGFEMVPSFHRDLVLGVATYAFELLTKIRDLDCLYVPIGMGSGICGCILVRDLLGLKTEIIGVQSTGAPSYALSVQAGHLVSTESAITNADGMSTRMPVADAFEIIQKGVSKIVLVNDDEIADAIRIYWTTTHNLAEGAGAASLAALIKDRENRIGQRAAVILSGGNIDMTLFRHWILSD
jgi:threonine dehydratase